MDLTNTSVKPYFIIKGMSDNPKLQLPFFLLMLLIYLVTLGGNMTILLLIVLDHHLHTPMYFFLGNVSTLDLSCSTVTLHKALVTYLSGDRTVSFGSCFAQIFLFLSLTCDELLILTAMSYDRYVAICNPLRYNVVMNSKACFILASASWVMGFLNIMPVFVEISLFTCYTSLEVNHFFCDVIPVLKLTCNDTSNLELYIIIEGVLLASFTPFILTFISYVFIISTILRIRSSIGRRKAFYTCSSHLTVVILLYGTLCYQYFRPITLVSLESSKVSSLFNTAAVPILNPLIYSLKNKDVIAAMRKLLGCFKTNRVQVKNKK
ncbi:olfactory receptor 8B8-like [Anomaloglossus baeobatrachus]|uniref:olfactory receptor 8B8-like n=1 Tax=Anomaloglossus baeobatrachus TaxID=238106 RepID=UPI003F4FB6B2